MTALQQLSHICIRKVCECLKTGPYTDTLAGISALFDLGIEGDAAVDPNWMVLWFNQPLSFGLPSKVYIVSPSNGMVLIPNPFHAAE